MLGPGELEARMGNNIVACRRRGCVWRGKLSLADKHACPYESCNEHSIEELRELLLEDERCTVKHQCMIELCGRGRVGRMCEEKLNIMATVFECMIKYAWAVPIQREGVGLITEIVNSEGGLEQVARACPGVRGHLRYLKDVPSLKHRVMLLLGESIEENDINGAVVLLAMRINLD